MMNERIDELAKQCYAETGSPHTDHFQYWKFAKLIREDEREACHLLSILCRDTFSARYFFEN
jgi:hypothetical protein